MKKHLLFTFTATLFVLILATCKKEKETPTASNKIEIGQTIADSVSYFYSQVKTTMTDLNGNAIREHGHCWGTSEKPTIDGNRSQLGALNQAATFASELIDLEDNTKYYVRYYLSMDNGTVYGEDLVFSTLKAGVPVVETSTVSNIDLYSAAFQGTVLSDSGAVVQSKGFCWHTQEDFSIEDCLDTTINGNGLGAFNAQISNLSEETTYYVKAYAINKKGVSYSLVESFKTVAITLPGLRTISVENITNNQATINAEVLNNGLGSINARGVCWHTQSDFDINNNSGFNNEDGDLGEFSSILIGLTENTTYFVKAFATNEKGTAYGETIEFNTSPITIPEVSTLEISGITTNTADGGGIVISDGYSNVSSRGVVWSTNENPTIENNDGMTSDGEGLGEFSSQLSNLSDGTIYFVKAYAANEVGTAYGEQKSFQTVGIGFPVLTTNNVTNITSYSAQSGGNITDAGNGSILARGICWNTTGNPTLENNLNFTTNGTGLGSFTAQMTSLSEGVQYYVAAYATNEQGTTYGGVKSFTTTDLSAPTVTTTNASNITSNSAVAGGNVTNDGNLTVTQRGVCWHTNPNPSLDNNLGYTSDGSGTGSFVSNINNLSEGTTYYFRAYAINSEGTGYGMIKEFTTINLELPTVSTNNITNIGTTYATGGGNVSNDGNSSVSARGVCWNTSGNPTLQNNTGYTTNGSGTGSFTSSLTGLNENTTYYVAAYATNSEGTAYGSIKSFTTLNITLPTVTTTTPTNITVNSAQSGGNVTSDGNATVTSRGVCWNTTGNPTLQNNTGYTTNGSGTGIFTSSLTGLDENTTYYVAAYATNSEGTSYGTVISFTTLLEVVLPTIITAEPNAIEITTALCGGNVTSDGNAIVTSRGVCWNITGNPTLDDNIGYTDDGTGTGSFVSLLSGLTENTIYYVAAYATNSVGTAYGSTKVFTTQDGVFIDPRDSRAYEIVQIGEQIWFAENLNFLTGSSWCYDDESNNCDIYGRLYLWSSAINACPDGWHLPSDDEWKILEIHIGMSQSEADDTGYRGTDEGLKLKSTDGWHENGNGINSFGFNALPAGSRSYDGTYYNLTELGNWWTSTNGTGTMKWERALIYSNDKVYRGDYLESSAKSVRCLKD